MRQKRRKQAGNKEEKSDFVSLVVLFGSTLEADIRKAAIGERTILLLLFQVMSQDSQRQKNWYSTL